MKRRTIAAGLGISAFLLFWIIACMFIPESDDLYFQYWEFASVRDFFLTQPVQADAAGIPANGRYLGNALGVVMSKLYAWDLNWLRALFLGGCMWGFCMLLGKYGTPEKQMHRFALGFGALMLAPAAFWKEVFSWSASFCNYFVPLLILLWILILFRFGRGGRWECLLGGILALCGQLFSETTTAFFLVMDGLLLLYAIYRKDRRRMAAALCLLLGAAAGGILMFRDPGYGQLGNDPVGRAFGFARGKNTLVTLLIKTVYENILVLPLSAALFHKKYEADSRRWIRRAVRLLQAAACCAAAGTAAGWFGHPLPEAVQAGVSACAVAAILALYAGLETGSCRDWIGIWILCYGANAAVMMGINPISLRHCFLGYVLLLLAVTELCREVGWLPVKGICAAAAAAGLVLAWIYHANYGLDRMRTAYILRAMEEKRQEIQLPLVPYPQYTINEARGKGDVNFIYYYREPWDIQFTFEPYALWMEEHPG